MKSRGYFPLGLAEGTAFCNRAQEKDLLINNLMNGKHTLLMATRRYGKSSLALHAAKLSALPWVELDFYMATSEKVIESYLLGGVVELIGKALGPVEKLLASIKRYAKSLKPKIDISSPIVNLELTPDLNVDPATNIKNALLLLESLLSEKKKNAVMILDEFQIIGSIAQGYGIEGAIRHVAQKTKYLSFIFLGSNRRLLQTMFEDEARPLYKLCWRLDIHRISTEHYQQHFNKAACLKWKSELKVEISEKILKLTENHPYYVNKLCDRLWTYCVKAPPTKKLVVAMWQNVLDEEKGDVTKELSALTFGQKNVLLRLVEFKGKQLTGKKMMLELQMTGSSIMTALTALEEKDIIEKFDGIYRVINPILKHYLVAEINKARKIKE